MVKNLSIAVLDFSKSSHGRVLFHIMIFWGSISDGLENTMDQMCILDSFAMFCEKPFCSSSCFKELPWKGFIPYQGLYGISIDLDTVRLDDQILAFRYRVFFLTGTPPKSSKNKKVNLG